MTAAMEGFGAEVSSKIRSAIKAKLIELGAYVDDELPDYIMVMVANKKTVEQMEEDLGLFLNQNTNPFVTWLHEVLEKLQKVSYGKKGKKKVVVKKKGKTKATKTKGTKAKAKTKATVGKKKKATAKSKKDGAPLPSADDVSSSSSDDDALSIHASVGGHESDLSPGRDRSADRRFGSQPGSRRRSSTSPPRSTAAIAVAAPSDRRNRSPASRPRRRSSQPPQRNEQHEHYDARDYAEPARQYRHDYDHRRGDDQKQRYGRRSAERAYDQRRDFGRGGGERSYRNRDYRGGGYDYYDNRQRHHDSSFNSWDGAGWGGWEEPLGDRRPDRRDSCGRSGEGGGRGGRLASSVSRVDPYKDSERDRIDRRSGGGGESYDPEAMLKRSLASQVRVSRPKPKNKDEQPRSKLVLRAVEDADKSLRRKRPGERGRAEADELAAVADKRAALTRALKSGTLDEKKLNDISEKTQRRLSAASGGKGEADKDEDDGKRGRKRKADPPSDKGSKAKIRKGDIGEMERKLRRPASPVEKRTKKSPSELLRGRMRSDKIVEQQEEVKKEERRLRNKRKAKEKGRDEENDELSPEKAAKRTAAHVKTKKSDLGLVIDPSMFNEQDLRHRLVKRLHSGIDRPTTAEEQDKMKYSGIKVVVKNEFKAEGIIESGDDEVAAAQRRESTDAATAVAVAALEMHLGAMDATEQHEEEVEEEEIELEYRQETPAPSRSHSPSPGPRDSLPPSPAATASPPPQPPSPPSSPRMTADVTPASHHDTEEQQHRPDDKEGHELDLMRNRALESMRRRQSAAAARAKVAGTSLVAAASSRTTSRNSSIDSAEPKKVLIPLNDNDSTTDDEENDGDTPNRGGRNVRVESPSQATAAATASAESEISLSEEDDTAGGKRKEKDPVFVVTLEGVNSTYFRQKKSSSGTSSAGGKHTETILKGAVGKESKSVGGKPMETALKGAAGKESKSANSKPTETVLKGAGGEAKAMEPKPAAKAAKAPAVRKEENKASNGEPKNAATLKKTKKVSATVSSAAAPVSEASHSKRRKENVAPPPTKAAKPSVWKSAAPVAASKPTGTSKPPVQTQLKNSATKPKPIVLPDVSASGNGKKTSATSSSGTLALFKPKAKVAPLKNTHIGIAAAGCLASAAGNIKNASGPPMAKIAPSNSKVAKSLMSTQANQKPVQTKPTTPVKSAPTKKVRKPIVWDEPKSTNSEETATKRSVVKVTGTVKPLPKLTVKPVSGASQPTITSGTSLEQCRFWPNCTRPNCFFMHPPKPANKSPFSPTSNGAAGRDQFKWTSASAPP